MTRTTVYVVALGVLVTVGLGVALAVSPNARALTVEVYLFVVAVLVVTAVLVEVRIAVPHSEPPPSRQPPRPNRLGQLEFVTRTLELAEASSYDLHHRLRPILREVAAARLARRGISLDRQPDRARALLGDQAWDLVRPDRVAPLGRSYRGCSRRELGEILRALEAV